MKLKITNTTDHQVIYNAEVTDKQTSARNYVFDVTLPAGVPNGEYEYLLYNDDETLSKGLLMVGNYSTDVDEVNNTIEYEQYR